MARPLGWGILGAGNIAGKFAADLKGLPDARLVAVGSRTAEKASQFAERLGIERAYGSYRELATDPEIDVVYIATPHPYHHDHTLLCLEAGKAVLCEKPLAVNASQIRSMVEGARRNRLFLMEAMWSRFNPVFVQVRRWLEEGHIGEVRMLTADFGFRAPWNPASRILSPALAGGALLDVGVYLVSLASLILGGPPRRIQAAAAIGLTGVDEQTGMLFEYAGGRLALLSCAVRTRSPQQARIDGTEGSIFLPDFWRPTRAVLSVAGHEPVEAVGQPSYQHEAAEVMACLRAGKTESPLMPLDESLAIGQTLDAVRAQIGLRYPMEAGA